MPDSDSESDSAASSAASELSRLPSLEPPTEPVRETVIGDNQDQKDDDKVETEGTPAGHDSGTKITPSSDSAPDPEAEPLHVSWEDKQEEVEETMKRPYFEGALAVE